VVYLNRGHNSITLNIYLSMVFYRLVITYQVQWKHYVVRIATRYEVDGPGIEFRWGEIFRSRPQQSWDPPSRLYNDYQVLQGGKTARAWHWTRTTIQREG
jgi:hypothetical protein